jgi:MarR family transcriptional regulator, transcriptional regulator for hemolysin
MSKGSTSNRETPYDARVSAPSGPPSQPPLGMQLSRTSKTVSRAFDDALAAAGGSRTMWLVLLAIKSGRASNQRELADAVDIKGATLTHHLNWMEGDELLTRRRDPDNRRAHRVELTEVGEAMFLRLRRAAMAHDERLRDGISQRDAAAFARVLNRMQQNVAD